MSISTTHYLKEGIKTGASCLTFAFGPVGVYQLYRAIREPSDGSHDWRRAAHKLIRIFASASLILSAGASRPGVFFISNLIGMFFTTGELRRVFGPNTIFAVNPWHPRHLASIVAVVLALPPVVELCIQRQPSVLHSLAFINTFTSRPFLHIANQIVHAII